MIGEESPWRAPRRSSTGPNLAHATATHLVTLREAVRSRAIQISEHLADDLSRSLKADYNFYQPAGESAHGLPLADCSRRIGSNRRAIPSKVVAFLDEKVAVRPARALACHATKSGSPRSHVSLGGQLRTGPYGTESGAVCTHTPASHQRATRRPPAVPCFSALSLGHPFESFRPVAGFHCPGPPPGGPPPPLSAAVGAAVRQRGQERRHVACCCASVKLQPQRVKERGPAPSWGTRRLSCAYALTPPHPSPPPPPPPPQARERANPREATPPCRPPHPPPCGGSSPYHVTLLSHAGFAARLASRGPSPASASSVGVSSPAPHGGGGGHDSRSGRHSRRTTPRPPPGSPSSARCVTPRALTRSRAARRQRSRWPRRQRASRAGVTARVRRRSTPSPRPRTPSPCRHPRCRPRHSRPPPRRCPRPRLR